jgi:hypothetical protein
MRRAQHAVFECMGKTLNSQYDAIVQEPLPQRWVDLIQFLNESERTPPDEPRSEPNRGHPTRKS